MSVTVLKMPAIVLVVFFDIDTHAKLCTADLFLVYLQCYCGIAGDPFGKL